jgi:hypothetical protein
MAASRERQYALTPERIAALGLRRDEAATQTCQQGGQLGFHIPFTDVPVTISLSATFGVSWSSTNDIGITFPPSAGAGVDITVGAPEGPNIPVAVGTGKNLSVGTYLTPQGPQGLSVSLGVSAGAPVTVSPTVENGCALFVGWF